MVLCNKLRAAACYVAHFSQLEEGGWPKRPTKCTQSGDMGVRPPLLPHLLNCVHVVYFHNFSVGRGRVWGWGQAYGKYVERM